MDLPKASARTLAAWALLLVVALPRAAAGTVENRAEVLESEEIDVVGTVPVPSAGTRIEDVPANVQVHRARELDRQHPTSAAAFLLQNGASVTVSEGQGNPFQPDVSFRGFTTSPLLGTPQGLSVFLDGVRVNEPFGDVVNWDLLPPGAIARIQLIPGSTPALGLNTLGGAVSVYTKSGAAFPGVAVEATGGTFGRRGASLEAGGSTGHLDGFATASFHDDDGWAEHNPSRVAQLFAKVGHQTEGSDLDLSLLLADTSLEGAQTLPRSWIADRRQSYTWPDRNLNQLAQAQLKGSVFLAREVLLGGTAYVRGLRSRSTASNVNDGYDPAVPASSPAFDERATVETLGWGAALQVTATPALAGRRNQLTVGAAADLGDTRFDQETRTADFTADRGTVATGDWAPNTAVRTTTRYLGLYASDTLSLADGLSLTVSGRFNAARVRIENRGDPADDALDGEHAFDRLNPAAGLAWTPRPAITAWAGYSEGARVPTPMELTCADPAAPCKLPNSFLADPPLRMVVARTVELGARGKLGTIGRWSAAVYRTGLEDDILFVNDPRSGQVNAGFFSNVGQTRRQGLEVGLAGRTAGVAWSLAYGFVDATFRTPFQFASALNSSAVDTNGDGVPDTVEVHAGDHIPGIPSHSAKVRVDWDVLPRVTVGASAVLASATYARGDENNADAGGRVPGWAVVGLAGTWRIVERLVLAVEVTNLLDARASSFGVLGENAFTGPNRSFGPAVGVDPVVEQFRSAGAPRGAWVSLAYRFGGAAAGADRD
jgi:outer membrane receptor protein involved in Fe transport